MNASSESGLWATEISFVAFTLESSGVLVLTSGEDPFGNNSVVILQSCDNLAAMFSVGPHHRSLFPGEIAGHFHHNFIRASTLRASLSGRASRLSQLRPKFFPCSCRGAAKRDGQPPLPQAAAPRAKREKQ